MGWYCAADNLSLLIFKGKLALISQTSDHYTVGDYLLDPFAIQYMPSARRINYSKVYRQGTWHLPYRVQLWEGRIRELNLKLSWRWVSLAACPNERSPSLINEARIPPPLHQSERKFASCFEARSKLSCLPKKHEIWQSLRSLQACFFLSPFFCLSSIRLKHTRTTYFFKIAS